MGYYMSQMDTSFYIAKEDVPKALTAVQSLPKKKYCWVGDFRNFSTFEEVMEEWRWGIEYDSEGNVVDIEFLGEKLGDDKVVFEAIAPFVKEDSYIQMGGEDNDMWRWSFTKGNVVESYPNIIWE